MTDSERPSWFAEFPQANHQALAAFLEKKQQWISQEKKGFLRYREPAAAVAHLRAGHCDCSGDVVRIGTAAELSSSEHGLVKEAMQAFIPWRKGPFSIFGLDIDAEWRSERKWNRVLPELPELSGKIIADVGCSNGYYMFRMAAHTPRFVLGFEPHPQHFFTFKVLNGFAAEERLKVELLGIEQLEFFPACFDVIFLMGIIYHRHSPIDALRTVCAALKPGGELILESQAIPGSEPVALFPEKTYAKVPGTWFVPTGACLVNWLRRAGFSSVRLFDSHPMSSREQRRSEWMTFESYQDFVDKADSRFTIEGYPAPWRVYVKAARKHG